MKQTIETRLTNCRQSEEADVLTVEIKLLGPDIEVSPARIENGVVIPAKFKKGEGTGVDVYRLRPVTGPERAQARKEASTGKQSASVDKDGVRSVTLALNDEIYNDLYLFFALGGRDVLGKGENKEGWSLKNTNGDPLPVTLDNVHDLHPGVAIQLIELAVKLADVSPASEKN